MRIHGSAGIEVSRRRVLGGALVVGAAATVFPGPVRAQSGVHRLLVGAAELTVLSDGTMAAPLGWVLPDRQRGEVGAVLGEAGSALGEGPNPERTLQVNVTLVKLGDELILIDAGGGSDFAPTRGKLLDNLEQAGIKPEAITKVVLTHAHPDHLWGLTDPLDGGTLFTKARHFLSAVERDYWLKPGIESTVPDAVRGAALGTQRRLKELGGRIESLTAASEIVPGMTMVDTAGHSPGHLSVLLSSGSEQLLIGGDALIDPVISFARPEWHWGPDWDQALAVAARKRTLDMLATEKIALLGYHLPWPGIGRVERRAGAYRFAQS